MASLLGAAASGGREYVLKIIADVKDAIGGVEKVQTATTGFKEKAIGIGKSVATGLAVAAVADFGMEAVNTAAEAEDAMDAVNSAFGESAGEIEKFSKSAADNMGLSAQDFQTMAAKTGQILTGFGINTKDAAAQTEILAQRGADMATIWGTSTDEAMNAINSAMMGNTRGLKKFGVSLTKSEIDARAMALGYTDASGKVTQAGRAIASQQLILEKTSKYQGEFAKNSGDLGSQQEILAAKMENLKATIGSQLLPVVIKLFDVIRPFIEFLTEHADILVPLAAGIMGVVAAIKAWE